MPPFVLDLRTAIQRPLPGAVRSIGAGKTAVVTLDVGPSYEGVTLVPTIAGVAATRAEIEAMLTSFRLTMSGSELFTLTGVQVCADAEFEMSGVIADTGRLYIPFAKNKRKTLDGAKGPSLGTLGETSLSLEIVQDGASTIDGLDVLASIDPVPAVPGKHIRKKRISPPLPGVGVSQWTGLYKNPNDVLYRLDIHCNDITKLTKFTYAGDGVRVLDQITQAQLAAIYRQAGTGRTLQTAKNVLSIDFCPDDWDNPIPLTMVEQLIEWEWSAAPTSLAVIAHIGTEERTQAGLQYAAAQAAAARR